MASSMMSHSGTVLMADDDPDDCLLTQDAWEECGAPPTLRFVRDGAELLDYLYHRGKFSDTADYSLPDMILLDLNMPRKNGHQALKEIRAHDVFRHIPVVVMTSSIDEDDTRRTYALGASACLTKPRSAPEFHAVVGALSQYWSGMVELPFGIENQAWDLPIKIPKARPRSIQRNKEFEHPPNPLFQRGNLCGNPVASNGE